jgi:hypothetical protein
MTYEELVKRIKHWNVDARLYLGTPFTHPDVAVQIKRYEAVTCLASDLTRDGLIVYSPVTHYWPQVVASGFHAAYEDQKLWERLNAAYLNLSDGLIVYCAEDWRKSHGLAFEIRESRRQRKAVFHLSCTQKGDDEL